MAAEQQNHETMVACLQQTAGLSMCAAHKTLHLPERMQDAKLPHQRLPARFSSISSMEGALVLQRSRLYMDMTKPGVQKPHWEPWALASLSCTGCRPSLGLPMPAQSCP